MHHAGPLVRRVRIRSPTLRVGCRKCPNRRVGLRRAAAGGLLFPARRCKPKAPGQSSRSPTVQRTLITGGAGFIGSHLCERFLAEGHEVLALDNFITGSRDNVAHLMEHPKFKVVVHDISKPVEFHELIDNVLHFASPASPVDYLEHPIPTMKVGALRTHNALGIAKRHKARFLLASTSEVYGDPLVHPQEESYWGNVNPIGIRGVYDEAKRFAESLTMAYHREHKVD